MLLGLQYFAQRNGFHQEVFEYYLGNLANECDLSGQAVTYLRMKSQSRRSNFQMNVEAFYLYFVSLVLSCQSLYFSLY